MRSQKETVADSIQEEEEVKGGENSTIHVEDIDHTAERRVRVKTDIHLMPVLCILLILAFLDRINIGNARIQGLEADLHMHGTDYNVALLIFFVPYILLDIPSNIIMRKVRPSLWLCGLMICWGIITVCQGLTKSYAGLVICRFLLGVFEGGFYPGAIYLISQFYPRFELQTRISLFFSSGIIAGAFSGLLSYGIAHMDGIGGYRAWRWIFILEGLATIVVSASCCYFLPDWPETARFLSEDDRRILLQKLDREIGEATTSSKLSKRTLKRALFDIKIWISFVMYFGCSMTAYSTSFFIPSILKGLGWTSLRAQYMSIPIWMTGFVIAVLVGFLADTTKHRFAFATMPLLFCMVGYAILLSQKHVDVNVQYMAIFFIVSGNFSAQPISLAWLSNNIVGHHKRGIATALQIALGNIGGIVASNIFITSQAPLYQVGYGVALAGIVLAFLSGIVFLLYLVYQNRARNAGKYDHLLALNEEELAELGDDHPSFRFTY